MAAGVGGIGWYGTANNAVRMEESITQDAEAVAGAAPYGVETQVSGRDITAKGLVGSQDELEALRAALDEVDGRRRVNVDGIDILPKADPFAMNATWTGSGWTGLSGAVPSEAARATLADASGASATDLALSTGAPDTAWTAAAVAGLSAGDLLEDARLTLSNTDLSIAGTALTPADVSAAEDAILANLPDGYTLTSDITPLDDGAPFSLTALFDGDAVELNGKLPAGADAAALGAVFSTLKEGTLDQSVLADESGAWPGMAMSGLTALAALQSGELRIVGDQMTLTGSGSPEQLAAAEAALSSVDGAALDLGLADDGAPFSFAVDYDGTAADVTGKLPANVALADLDGQFEAAAFAGDVQSAFISDDTGVWPAIAQTGLAGLAKLEAGRLAIVGNQLELSGMAATPTIEDEISTLFAALPEGIETSLSLDYLDDGAAPSWDLSYSAADGAMLDGKLPAGMTSDDFAARLGVDELAGDARAGLVDADVSEALSALEIAAEYLPETESMNLRSNGDGVALDLALSPGVDAELIALDLAERLPGSVDLSLGTVGELPAEGSSRVNRFSGREELFRNGNWLPVLDFEVSRDVCDDEAKSAIAASGVNFLSGSAQLDAKSIRAINLLSAIVERCVTSQPLNVEVGGHTDSSGDDALNQELSEARANAVRDALVARGVESDFITAVGYGETQPIADNETDEGKAANRRTELTWQDRPAPAPEPVETEEPAAEAGESDETQAASEDAATEETEGTGE